MFSLHDLVLVIVGGGIGSAGRYIITTLIGARFGTVFPFGTCFVNVLGCFLMGLIMTLAIGSHRVLSETTRLLLVVGFLGGFTTFSSFGMETMTLLTGKDLFFAFTNIVLNIGLGFLGIWCGISVTKII